MQLVKEAMEKISRHVIDVSSSLDSESIEKLIEELLNAQKIFVFGTGRSGLVAKAFAMRLMQLGLNVYVIGETISPPTEKNDLIILVSGSGETHSVVFAAQVCRKIGTKIVGVTSDSNSTLAKYSDLIITLKGGNKYRKNAEWKIAPLGTLFEITAMVFFDAIVAELMSRKGMEEETLRKRHAIIE